MNLNEISHQNKTKKVDLISNFVIETGAPQPVLEFNLAILARIWRDTENVSSEQKGNSFGLGFSCEQARSDCSLVNNGGSWLYYCGCCNSISTGQHFFFTKRRAESGTKGFATLRKGPYLFSNFIAGSPADRWNKSLGLMKHSVWCDS